MNTPSPRALVAMSISLATAIIATAQTSPNPTDDQTVILSPFNVSAAQAGRYTAAEAASGGRISTNLMDASQSISVVTRDMMDDTGALTVLEAAKYVSGITESTIPNVDDRVEIRGFQSEGAVIDGFSVNGQAMFPLVFIDRMEVVKGPDAILAPSSVPGGTIDLVTRKPQFSNFGSVSAQFGRWDGNLAQVDYNQKLNEHFAYRLDASYQDSKNWVGAPSKTAAEMSSFTYRNDHGLQATLQWQFLRFVEQNYFGIPIDPSAGTLTHADIIHGVPRDLNYDGDTFRNDSRPAELRLLVTDPITDALSVRLAAHHVRYEFAATQAPAGGATGGGVDPYTGDYVPGTIWTGSAATGFTPTAAPPQPTTSVRSGKTQHNENTYDDFQNDWVYRYTTKFIDTTTLAGFSYDNQIIDDYAVIDTATTPINYYAPTPTVSSLGTAVAGEDANTVTRIQGYITEKATLFGDRLILTGGYTDVNFVQTADNKLANQKFDTTVDRGLVNYGAIVKPIPELALYFGHSRTSVANGPSGVVTGNTPPTSDGIQDEGGLRVQILNQRIFATFSYFHIVQTAYSIGNPADNAVPVPVPLLPPIFSDRLAKGWEFEIHGAITPELSVVANATSFTNRDPNNIPIRGEAEKSAAGAIHYAFARQSLFHGFSLGVSGDWLAKRSGDQGSGLTALNVPIQPSFYLPARTLINVMAAYQFGQHWSAQLNVDNVFNTKYLQSALSRFSVFPGEPINESLNISYHW